MCLTFAEVISRYGFNAPIKGRQDVAQILLACSIFFAFPVVTLRNEQIVADLLDSVFSKGVAKWRDRVIDLMTAVSMITMGYWLLLRAEKAFKRGSVSEMLSLPKYPIIVFIAIVVLVTGVLLLLRVIWFKRTKPETHA
jgi:TRAP-type C4-dicarboxylate transport system permease small subunit